MRFLTELTKHASWLSRHGLLLGGVMALLSGAGCATMNEFCDEMTLHAMVRQAQRQYSAPCDLKPKEVCHYKSGWREGYYSVATGGDGCPPLVAPQKYWKLGPASPACNVDIWYRGFADGAAIAHEDGAQNGYFVPVMNCCCTSGGACSSYSSGCCAKCQLGCCQEFGSTLQEPDALELPPEPVEAKPLSAASKNTPTKRVSHVKPTRQTKPISRVKPAPEVKLSYPDDLIPHGVETISWEQPLEHSTSAWFGQPRSLTMELAERMNDSVAVLEKQVREIPSTESTLTLPKIALVNFEEIAGESDTTEPVKMLLPSALSEADYPRPVGERQPNKQ